jgi:hypothetical protein
MRTAALLGSLSIQLFADTHFQESRNPQGVNVLYVTHEPGKWHKYTPQREIFEEIAEVNKWNLEVMSGSQDEVVKKLATDKDFGKGADVIVYNFCLAHKSDPEVPHNIITQTQDKGVPALLIHCSLHSFWPTYKEGGRGVHPEGAHEKVKAKKELIAAWKEKHPGVAFPAWPNMTGIASTAHGTRQPIDAKPLESSHPCFAGVEGYTTHQSAELYNNFITAQESPQTKVLMEGLQGKAAAAILWEHPVGKSKSLSFTLGHGIGEWKQEPFQRILVNSVNYLAAGQ